MSLRHFLFVPMLASLWQVQARAEEAAVEWYDPTCRFFVMKLADGYGLYEWKSGPEPKAGDVLEGNILEGPPVSASNKVTGEQFALVHWGDSGKRDVLIRNAPGWCRGKKKALQ